MPGTPLSNPKPPAGPNAVGPTRPMTRAAASAPTALAGMSPKTPAKVPGLTTSVRTSGQLAQLPTPLKPVGMEHNASRYPMFRRLGRSILEAEERYRKRKQLPYRSAEELMRLPTKTPGAATKTPRHPDDDLFEFGPKNPSAPIPPPRPGKTIRPYDPDEWF